MLSTRYICLICYLLYSMRQLYGMDVLIKTVTLQKIENVGTVSKKNLPEGFNRFHSANLTLSSDTDQDT